MAQVPPKLTDTLEGGWEDYDETIQRDSTASRKVAPAPARPVAPAAAAASRESESDLLDTNLVQRGPVQRASDLVLTKPHSNDQRMTAMRPVAALDPRAAQNAFAPGTMIGEYQLERVIGEGSMGVVYAAVHPMIGKRAAVKVLQRELCSDRIAVGRFIDEAKIINEIGHPNIVDVFAFGRAGDGRSYFVMEWLNGESLAARISRGPCAVAETCHVLLALCRALAAAHSKGVVHRDLKPDNVFLVAVPDEPPHVKLLDFGVAKLLGPDRVERTASGAVVGTPAYLSPEQARGQRADHRADIYSLGVIAFEMLAGRPPYENPSPLMIAEMHATAAVPRVSDHATDAPPELDDIVYRMLSKVADQRPALQELKNIVETIRLDRALAERTGRTPRVEPSAMLTPLPMPRELESGPFIKPRQIVELPRRSSLWLAIPLTLVLAVVIGVIVFFVAR